MDPLDAIALLLAARHEPAIRDLADYQKAEALVEEDPGLRRVLDAEVRYYDANEDLLSGVRLPEDAKARMKEALLAALPGDAKPAGQVVSFPVPWLRLAAAAAIVLVVGLAVVRFAGVGDGPEVAAAAMDPFSQFATRTVIDGFDLAYRSESPPDIVRWLAGRDTPMAVSLAPAYMDFSTMGCTVLDWDGNEVAMICFRSGEDIVHLFVAETTTLRGAKGAVAKTRRVVEGREIESWMDDTHAYVLVAHNPGQKLGDFPG